MGQSLEKSTEIAQYFASQRPFLVVNLYNRPLISEPSIPRHASRVKFPEHKSVHQLFNHNDTEESIKHGLSDGSAIHIYPGYSATVETKIGNVDLFIDTDVRVDPLLAGIIYQARKLFKTNPNWDIGRKMFEIGKLCLGDWGQKRYPLQSFKEGLSDLPSEQRLKLVLGEHIWTTTASDIECAALGMCMQVVGQACDLDIGLYLGYSAKFSSNCRGNGPHAWNLVQASFPADGQIVVDWTNFPPEKVEQLFESVKDRDADELYRRFLRIFGGFPPFVKDSNPPSAEDYYDFINGDKPMLGTLEKSVYWSDFSSTYLGSCNLPRGWEGI